MISTLIGTGIGVVVGGVITYLVAKYYYKRAGDDLHDEAKELRRLTEMVLRGLESADLVKINRDESGKLISIAFSMRADAGQYGISGSEMSFRLESDRQNQDNAAQG